MQHTTTISINGKSYNAVFNTLALRKFAEQQGIETVNEAILRVVNIASYKKDENGTIILENGMPVIEKVSWDGIDNIIIYLLCAIREASRIEKSPCDLTTDDLYSLLDDEKGWAKILEILTGSLPAPEDKKESSGNLESPGMPG